MCDCAIGQQRPPERSGGCRQWGCCSDRPSAECSHKPPTGRDGNMALSPPHHDTSTKSEMRVWFKQRETDIDELLPEGAGAWTHVMQTTWKTLLCMTEHTVSAYCLLWVYVVQGSGGASLGRVQRSVVNFPAKDDTLFSTSPSGVVKSSCWFQVNVPHRPRTLKTIFTFWI